MSIFPHPFLTSGCTQTLSCTGALLEHTSVCAGCLGPAPPAVRDHQWLPLMLLVGVVSKLHFVSNNGTLSCYKQLYKIFIFSKQISQMILSKKNLAFIFENGACVIKNTLSGVLWMATYNNMPDSTNFSV